MPDIETGSEFWDRLKGKELENTHQLLRECGYNFDEPHPECYRNFSYVKLASILRDRAPALPSPDGAGEAVAEIDPIEFADRIERTSRRTTIRRADCYAGAQYGALIDCFRDFEVKRLVAFLRATPPVRADREALDQLYNEKIENIIDQWTADTLKREFASSWHYGELWKQVREAILSRQPPQSSSEGAAVASQERP